MASELPERPGADCSYLEATQAAAPAAAGTSRLATPFFRLRRDWAGAGHACLRPVSPPADVGLHAESTTLEATPTPPGGGVPLQPGLSWAGREAQWSNQRSPFSLPPSPCRLWVRMVRPRAGHENAEAPCFHVASFLVTETDTK